MIKVIDGKRYNTETAKSIHENSNGHFVSDFRFRIKHLMRTSNGAWFFHHVGGALSDMSVNVGNWRTGSEAIEPVSDEDAYGFLEAHSEDSLVLEAIEKFFSGRITEA